MIDLKLCTTLDLDSFDFSYMLFSTTDEFLHTQWLYCRYNFHCIFSVKAEKLIWETCCLV